MTETINSEQVLFSLQETLNTLAFETCLLPPNEYVPELRRSTRDTKRPDSYKETGRHVTFQDISLQQLEQSHNIITVGDGIDIAPSHAPGSNTGDINFFTRRLHPSP